MDEFKNLFGTVGEDVVKLIDQDELMEETEERLLHRKTFYDETNNIVIVISMYHIVGGFKIIITEPSINPNAQKSHQFEVFLKDCFTRREMEFFDLESTE